MTNIEEQARISVALRDAAIKAMTTDGVIFSTALTDEAAEEIADEIEGWIADRAVQS